MINLLALLVVGQMTTNGMYYYEPTKKYECTYTVYGNNPEAVSKRLDAEVKCKELPKTWEEIEKEKEDYFHG
jgi:hypothetical protein